MSVRGDITCNDPKISRTFGSKLDIVVTVCGHAQNLPFSCRLPGIPPGSRTPEDGRDLAEEGASEEEQMNCYRKVRDEIKAFVETLPEALKEGS